MASNVVNLFLDQGAEFYRTMTVVDVNNLPINLTNYTIAGQIRKTYTSVANTSLDLVFLDRIAGRVSMGLNHSVTETLQGGKYVYDIEITSPENKKYRILEGVLTVNPNVTR